MKQAHRGLGLFQSLIWLCVLEQAQMNMIRDHAITPGGNQAIEIGNGHPQQ
jgi:hypothetical protein